jgi:hypothetical protein
MRSFKRCSVQVVLAALATFVVAPSVVQAVEVLFNGGLELSAGPQGWTLTQSITGEPGLPISATEHVDLANEPMIEEGELGLLIKPFAGNVGVYDGQNKRVNVSLSQTFTSAVAGRTYTFSGNSFFQAAASNIITTLFPDSPSGAIPSPTQSYFRMEFLNASDVVLATHEVDLRSNPTTEAWRLQSVAGTAPATTTKVRVTALATDMVASCTTSCPAGQDVYFDNFRLRDNVVTGLERLQNPELNTLGAPAGWAIEKTPQDNIQFSGASYAINPNTGSTVGMWLRSFAGGDAKIVQTVPGTPGGQYTFSGWSKWELGYSGADPFSSTQTFMTMEFLNSSNALIGSPVTLDLRTVQINDNTWRQFSVPTTTAPAGTAFVRVSAGATGMANSGINPQSAMFDDFSLTVTGVGLTGDYNGDGKVDAGDYVVWRKNPGAFGGDPGGYNAWRANFGAMAGSGSGNLLASAVPEPAACVLLAIGLMAGIVTRRR